MDAVVQDLKPRHRAACASIADADSPSAIEHFIVLDQESRIRRVAVVDAVERIVDVVILESKIAAGVTADAINAGQVHSFADAFNVNVDVLDRPVLHCHVGAIDVDTGAALLVSERAAILLVIDDARTCAAGLGTRAKTCTRSKTALRPAVDDKVA